MMLDNVDRLTAQIDKLTAQVEELITPFERQVVQLDGITGIGRSAAQDLIAEIGVDMSVFATAGHLVSWAKYCPQVKQSAGKRKGRNSHGKGNRYVAGVLGEASVAAGRTRTRRGARYRRLAKRRGKAKAQVAVGNTILTIATHCFPIPPPTTTTSASTTTRPPCITVARSPATCALQRLGYKVTLESVDGRPPDRQRHHNQTPLLVRPAKPGSAALRRVAAACSGGVLFSGQPRTEWDPAVRFAQRSLTRTADGQGMSQPVLLMIDDDSEAMGALRDDLTRQSGGVFPVIGSRETPRAARSRTQRPVPAASTRHTCPPGITQQPGPGLGGLAVPVSEGDQLLLPVPRAPRPPPGCAARPPSRILKAERRLAPIARQAKDAQNWLIRAR